MRTQRFGRRVHLRIALLLPFLSLACFVAGGEDREEKRDTGVLPAVDRPVSGPADTLSGVAPFDEPPPDAAGATDVALGPPPADVIDRDPVAYLYALALRIPVAGLSRDELPPSNFDQARGTRRHDAYDILAPRGTPVLAATGGRVATLHISEAGGNMVYTIDESGRFVLFYAHLDRYHSGIHDGMALERGDTVGYVGTTGNAPPDVPHLHFAIVLMDEDRRWWKGSPIDPQPILAREPR
jgi:murein DD-endopeptidase MepM/ murein hydrolase activator NlpD